MPISNLRYAFRSLARAPSFTVTVVLTLALGIGASTLIYSVIDGVLLKPLPYPEPNRIVRVLRRGRVFERRGRAGSRIDRRRVGTGAACRASGPGGRATERVADGRDTPSSKLVSA